MTDEERHEHVVGLVNQINAVLGGEDLDDGCTALTLAVTCQIIFTANDRKERVQQCRVLAKQLEAYVQRDDIVAWVKASITPVNPATRNQ